MDVPFVAAAGEAAAMMVAAILTAAAYLSELAACLILNCAVASKSIACGTDLQQSDRICIR